MKRTLALLLLASLVTTPALAYGQQDDRDKIRVDSKNSISWEEAVVEATREVVAKDSTRLTLVTPQTTPGRAGSGWRTVIGIAMMVGGAGIIAKGASVYEGADRFGRVKNADAYVAYGVGGGIMAFGFITLKGGLQGRGF